MDIRGERSFLFLQVAVAIVLCLFTGAAYYGIYIFELDEGPSSYEGLHITAYVWFFSLLPQLGLVVVSIVNIMNRKYSLVVLSMIPLALMWVAYWYGKQNGMPI